jgi:hypothetical protein
MTTHNRSIVTPARRPYGPVAPRVSSPPPRAEAALAKLADTVTGRAARARRVVLELLVAAADQGALTWVGGGGLRRFWWGEGGTDGGRHAHAQ